LLRLKGKDRLTRDQWLGDWTYSLQKQDFVLNSQLVTSRRTRTTGKGIRKPECICLQNGGTAVFLYASIHAVPKEGLSCPAQFLTVLHIVRGRRRDSAREITRMEDTSMAKGILPGGKLGNIHNVMVDFDDSLFSLGSDGTWRETADESACDIYRLYRDNSAHFTSIRPRLKEKDSKILS
jgi:hypothetical protein